MVKAEQNVDAPKTKRYIFGSGSKEKRMWKQPILGWTSKVN